MRLRARPGGAGAVVRPKRATVSRAGCARARGFGDFWSHVLVAEGAGELALEPEGVSAWDLAPLSVIVEEAGGAVHREAEDRASASRPIRSRSVR